MGTIPIGTLSIQLLRSKGADVIVVSDMSDLRLSHSARFGADVTVNVRRQDLSKALKHALGAWVLRWR